MFPALRLPGPDAHVPLWHVSPAIDLSAYAFSWLWALVPLVLLGDTQSDYLGAYIFIVLVTDVHRHFGLPYAYLDREVFRTFRVPLVVLPVALFPIFAASPWLAEQRFWLQIVDVFAILAGILWLVRVLHRAEPSSDPVWRELALSLGLAVTLGSGLAGGGAEPGWAALLAIAAASVLLDALAARRGDRRRPIASLVILGLIAGLMAWPFLGLPPYRVRPLLLLNATAVVAGVWNLWHVYMQKYGVLRLYHAKACTEARARRDEDAAAAVPGSASDPAPHRSTYTRDVPPFVDRWLVFGWVPLFFAYLGPASRGAVERNFGRGELFLTPLLDGLSAIQTWTLPPAILCVAFSIAVFVGYERRAHGLRNRPRLCMALGTTLLNASLLVFDPVKVYLAFAFSHAVEYMVFVWAYQRRRYARESARRLAPILVSALARPWLAYGGFIVGLGLVLLYTKYYGRHVHPLPDDARPTIFGYRAATWVVYWTTFQSMVHFYMDGFLWKMRSAQVRAHL